MSYDNESRLRAIAMNAVREAMLVQNRWDKPFTDDDAARTQNIFELLHLQEVAFEAEHAPLVLSEQAPVNPALASSCSPSPDRKMLLVMKLICGTSKASVMGIAMRRISRYPVFTLRSSCCTSVMTQGM